MPYLILIGLPTYPKSETAFQLSDDLIDVFLKDILNISDDLKYLTGVVLFRR